MLMSMEDERCKVCESENHKVLKIYYDIRFKPELGKIAAR